MGSGSSVPCYNQELPNTKEKGFTSIYRKKGVTKLIDTPDEKLKNVGDLLRNTAKLYGKSRGIGQVKVEQGKDEANQTIETRSIIEHTYQEAYDTAFNLGRSLFHNKLYYTEPIHKMKLIGIHSKNRYEWFLADWACVFFGLTIVPLYDTLGIENLTYCLKQTEMTSLFVTADTLQTLVKLKDHGSLQTVISFDPIKPEMQEQLKSLNLKLLYFSDLVTMGESLTQVNNNDIVIKPDDCYTFSFTSGTTGPPKGAMISHRNILAFVAGTQYHTDLCFHSSDIYLSYLPLPHLMERGLALSLFMNGTFLVISSGDMTKLKEDCQIVKPSVFVSVPRVYNRIVEATRGKIHAAEGVKGCLAQRALASKVENANEQGGYSSCFYDSVVFSKVRAEFGGAVRVMATGSAPMNPDIFAHMKAIMCCPLIEGYGQTQSASGVLYSRAYDRDYGVLSEISVGAQIKLADIPEMKYTSEDKDSEGRPSPRGELLIRGPQVFLGYYKAPEITRQTIANDGWLRTGDVGQIIPGSYGFKIIDRKKNIFKLQQGQYVAPDKVENVYLKSSLLSEIFLHGDSKQNYAVAIAVPNKENLIELATSKGIKGSFEQLCASKQVKALVLSEINSFGKKQGLFGFELAKNIELQTQGFLAKNILTNTMKLIRFEARTCYAAKIEKMYQEGELSLPK